MDDWLKMEANGCVFLPAAGYRRGTSVLWLGQEGSYWSESHLESEFWAESNYAVNVFFNCSFFSNCLNERSDGLSVRLVQDVR